MTARWVVVVLCLCAASTALMAFNRAERVPVRESLAAFPMDLASWHGDRAPAFTARILHELGVDDYLNATYRGSAREIGLYVGYYASQRQGDAIHSPANCLPGAGWQPESTGLLPIQVANGAAVNVNRWVIRKGDEQQLVLYWYQSHGRVVASEYASKVHLVMDAVRLNRTDAALVRVITPITDNSPAAYAAAEQAAVSFVRSMFPQLVRFVPV
jgi:EpsI family protein